MPKPEKVAAETDPAKRLEYQRNAQRETIRQILNGELGLWFNEAVGCNRSFLGKWIQSQFQPWMSWDNAGREWHIDHIKALAHFDLDDTKQRRECNHFSNLRPLEAKKNHSKRADAVAHRPHIFVSHDSTTGTLFRFSDWVFIPRRGAMQPAARHEAFLGALNIIALEVLRRFGIAPDTGGPQVMEALALKLFGNSKDAKRALRWLPRVRLDERSEPDLFAIRRVRDKDVHNLPLTRADKHRMLSAVRFFIEENPRLFSIAEHVEAMIAGSSVRSITEQCGARLLAEAWQWWYFPCRPATSRVSVREMQILRLIVDGKTNEEIGGALGLSRRTINAHVERIQARLGIRRRHALVLHAIKSGIVSLEKEPRPQLGEFGDSNGRLRYVTEAWSEMSWEERHRFLRWTLRDMDQPDAARVEVSREV
jgi:DNA-binding CsgD family transcriptional regulator